MRRRAKARRLRPTSRRRPRPRGQICPTSRTRSCAPVCGTLLALATESPQANRERDLIRGLIAQGLTKDQIKDRLVVEFGPNVLATPSTDGFDITAWLVPGLAVVVAAIAIFFGLRRWRRETGERDEAAADAPARSATRTRSGWRRTWGSTSCRSVEARCPARSRADGDDGEGWALDADRVRALALSRPVPPHECPGHERSETDVRAKPLAAGRIRIGSDLSRMRREAVADAIDTAPGRSLPAPEHRIADLITRSDRQNSAPSAASSALSTGTAQTAVGRRSTCQPSPLRRSPRIQRQQACDSRISLPGQRVLLHILGLDCDPSFRSSLRSESFRTSLEPIWSTA